MDRGDGGDSEYLPEIQPASSVLSDKLHFIPS